jgi:hypothetical protein
VNRIAFALGRSYTWGTRCFELRILAHYPVDPRLTTPARRFIGISPEAPKAARTMPSMLFSP